LHLSINIKNEPIREYVQHEPPGKPNGQDSVKNEHIFVEMMPILVLIVRKLHHPKPLTTLKMVG
jgi:hypothetical protein